MKLQGKMRTQYPALMIRLIRYTPRYFSCVDLASGYWQVELQEEDEEKTAFSTPYGLY